MRRAMALAACLVLSGCITAQVSTVPIADTYTRDEIDAINAETQCRALARTVVQMSRCEVARR